METLILALLTFMAPAHGIDPLLAASVIKVESRFQPKAIGGLGEVGLFQIRPQFSKYSKTQLLEIHTNLKAGLEMLSDFKQTCKHKVDNSYVICHNLGKSGAKKIRNPFGQTYYKKVNKNYLAYLEN